MIPEHKYADYYWISLVNFSKEEWERFKQDFSPFTKLMKIDGVDEEETSLCFTFSRYVPKNYLEISKCKKLNTLYKKEFLKALQQDIRGRVYFNVKRGIIKKL